METLFTKFDNNLDFTTNREIIKLIRARVRGIYIYYRKLQKEQGRVITTYTSFARKELKKLNKAYKVLNG